MALCQLPYIMKCINLTNCQPIENFSNLFVIVFNRKTSKMYKLKYYVKHS